MNDARITLRLPGECLEFARNYASEREMTLTDLVIGYFKKLKESMAVRDELPECVRGMVGIIPAGDGDSVEEYHDHLMACFAHLTARHGKVYYTKKSSPVSAENT